MKMKRIILCYLLLTILTLSSALAQTVERAAQPVDASQFAHYPSFAQEEDRWSVHAIQADALLDRFWTAGSQAQLEMCIFHPALEGNAQTGVWTPVLRFYYIDGPKAINARAVSLLADGVRYDLAASSTTVSRDRATSELITAPLTAEAAQALTALTEAESIAVRLMGDAIYTVTLDARSQTERGLIEFSSRAGLEAGFALWEEAGLSAYALWDLSAQAWESEHGYRPHFARSEVSAELRGEAVTDAFGMIMTNARGRAAQAARDILTEYGFLNEKTNAIFTQNASEAAARAQRYLGLVETGGVDAQLEQALSAGRQSAAASAPQLQALGSTAGVALDRYWFARAVSASADAQSRKTVHNSDNVFLAADGCIRNLSQRQLHLFMQVQASVICNDTYAFAAEMVCEGSEGTVLDTLLLPLAQARVIVYAEVPAYLAQDPDARWTIELTADGQTLTFDLQ